MKRFLTTANVKTKVSLSALFILMTFSLPVYAYFPPAKNVPVVMYHKVDVNTPTGYWTSARTFRHQMYLLHDLGYETVGFEDLRNDVCDVTPLPAKSVIVTFDDSYQDIYTCALPVMQEFTSPNFFGVVHVITDYTGDNESNRKQNTWDQPAEPNAWHMIWPEVTALYNAGWSIEAHSRTHKHNTAGDFNAVYEAGSAAVIASKAGIPEPNFYAYPFGEYNTALMNALQSNGYLGGMNASGGVENTSSTNIWHIKRIEVLRDDTIDQFASKIGVTVPAEPRLTVNVSGSGSVQISPDQPYYDTGTVVTLTAVPEPFWQFSNWSGNLSGSNNPETITMDASKTVTANFVFNGTGLLSDGFETNFDKWTDGGTTDWDRATDQKHSGSYSAHAGSADNDLISDNMNTSGYAVITITFWYRDDDIDDDDDIYLQLYNGSTYNNRFELGNSTEDVWHQCIVTINNSGSDAQYFIPNFRIKFEGTSIDTGENLWIDDVVVAAAVLPTRTLTVSSSAGGTVTTPGIGDFNYPDGNVVNLAASADTGYHFVNWTGDTGTINDVNSAVTTITMDANHAIQANFAVNQYTISGNTGVGNVTLEGLDVLSDGDGNYTKTVDYGWDGTVTPTKAGYTFEPVSRTYTDVAEDHIGDNYAATLNTYTISGNTGVGEVTLEGLGIASDGSGNYTKTVDYGWSGIVTPSKAGYTFNPADRTYTSVAEDHIGDDYAATLNTYKISGYIKNECNEPVEEVLVDANNGGEDTTDVNGFYEVVVDYNWSGTVTPSKQLYTFEPNLMSYVNVIADQPDQNYVAYNVYDLDCDGSIGFGDVAVISDNWLQSGENLPGDLFKDDTNTVNFLDFAEFANVW